MVKKTINLRKRLLDGDFICAPGIFDMISALIADRLGFSALYMTGYGTVASALGLPDAGLATYSDMVGRVTTMCRQIHTPLIADGDTGYGGLLNVQHTVKGYEQAGAAAIQLEDQEFPKKCGHTKGRRVIAIDDAVAKIKVAVDSRDSRDFLIIARTDARTAHGLEEALRRGEAFAEAGADIVFIESPEDEAELARIGQALAGHWLLANMVEGGRTPILSQERLSALGFSIAIFPATGFLAAGAALQSVYAHIADTGSSLQTKQTLSNFETFNKLMGFQAIWDFDAKWAEQTIDSNQSNETK